MRPSDFARDVWKYARQSAWFQTAALALLVAVLSAAFLLPFQWAVVACPALMALGLVGWQIFRTYRRLQQTSQAVASNREIRAPDQLAEERVAQNPEPCLVVGSAVETLIHSTLNTKADYLELGWDPAHVQIIDTKEVIDPKPLLGRIPGGLLPLAPNESNDIKFVLARRSHIFKDNEDDLQLSFKRTDWQTHKTVRNPVNGIEKDDDLALEFGSLDVEKSRVPSSVGLHYIVRFTDDSVLLLKRASQIAHEQNRWSISGEEQFKAEDFEEGTLLRVFRRALCEEVVGLFDRAGGTLETRWREHVASKIKTMRLWGLLFEEHACVTSLLGFYQFGISKREFVEWHKQLVDCSVGTRDNEGKLYTTTTDELDLLLRVGTCRAWPLFQQTSEPAVLQSGQLHKTSRYRAYRLVRAIKGKLPSIGTHGTSVLRIARA